jgi:hypothetical protein
MHCCTDLFNLDWWVFLRAIGGYRWLAWPQFAITPFPNIASSMQAPQSGASSATAAPAAEETPKAAVPSEAQLGLDIETVRGLSRFVRLSSVIYSHPFPLQILLVQLHRKKRVKGWIWDRKALKKKQVFKCRGAKLSQKMCSRKVFFFWEWSIHVYVFSRCNVNI